MNKFESVKSENNIGDPGYHLNLESIRRKLTHREMEKCRPSAPFIAGCDKEKIGFDIWLDWNDRLFFIVEVRNDHYTIRYLRNN
jgi:hypothetical protein